jgi:hypothetical protein
LSWVTQPTLPGGGFVIEVAVLNFDIKKMVGMVLSRVTQPTLLGGVSREGSTCYYFSDKGKV